MNSSSRDLLILDTYTLELSKVAVSLNAIVSLPMNAYVMFLIHSQASLAQEFFSFNLAVSEALYSLLSLTYFGYLEKNLHWLIYEIFMFSDGLLYTARPLFQCCICVEYYLGVVHPVLFLHCRPLRYRAACCGVAWLITLVACFNSRNIFSALYSYVLLAQNLLLLSVIVFCCMSVLRALKQPGPGEGGRETGGNAQKRRAFNIILLIMLSMLVKMLLHVVATLLLCCLSPLEVGITYRICASLALFIGFTQPLFYLYRTAKLDCCRRT